MVLTSPSWRVMLSSWDPSDGFPNTMLLSLFRRDRAVSRGMDSWLEGSDTGGREGGRGEVWEEDREEGWEEEREEGRDEGRGERHGGRKVPW